MVEGILELEIRNGISCVTCLQIHEDHLRATPRLRGVGRNLLASVVSRELETGPESEMCFLLGGRAVEALAKEGLEVNLVYEKSYLRHYLTRRSRLTLKEIKMGQGTGATRIWDLKWILWSTERSTHHEHHRFD